MVPLIHKIVNQATKQFPTSTSAIFLASVSWLGKWEWLWPPKNLCTADSINKIIKNPENQKFKIKRTHWNRNAEEPLKLLSYLSRWGVQQMDILQSLERIPCWQLSPCSPSPPSACAWTRCPATPLHQNIILSLQLYCQPKLVWRNVKIVRVKSACQLSSIL